MKIDCLHGYFKFTEEEVGEIFNFGRLYELSFVPVEDYFTFAKLEGAPDYSLEGSTFLEAPTTETFAGKPWEVMEQNGLIYNFEKEILEPIESVTRVIKIMQAESYFIADGLILPGSLAIDGSRLKSYSAWFSRDLGTFKYSTVSYV